MKVNEIAEILDADVICGTDKLDTDVFTACGSDMMSDVLAFVKEQAVLLTGLINSQVIRTAEMMDMKCVVFVRGKVPDAAMASLASEKGIPLLATRLEMFTACGRLFEKGLRGRTK